MEKTLNVQEEFRVTRFSNQPIKCVSGIQQEAAAMGEISQMQK